MNTEPPTGDDLQQMLVSMKREVLTRADQQRPAPRRRGRRAGIVIGVIAVLGIGATSGGVALGMIPQPFAAAPAPSPSATTVAPSETPTPSSAPVVSEPTSTPSSTPSPTRRAAVLPTDCRSMVPEADYERLFGQVPVRDETSSIPVPQAPFPDTSLRCVWMDPSADVSGISVDIGTATPEQQAQLESTFADGPEVCSDRDGGRFCQATWPADPYPVDTTVTYFGRGTTWIQVTQTNAPTDGLLKAIEQQVWG
ncbi:hypothetical protein DEJ13_14345 [Curtobacterium sp. MCLR17_007]|uniref:hypothetical protein n=1 Tax=Curtobacterium sp. MCLR17_007 TaxID=2175648 RepID=UPI0011B3C964|nr:hypothetical protein [Curtobacterium sp. MCLR17_007]WIB59607.1 hypothetical protein DEJ13_14345 [Curtobacterium sp. MCLR17_007]